MPTVPIDSRPQFSMLDVILANTKLGRPPFAGVEQVGPDRYVVAGSWPAAPARDSFSPLVAASAVPDSRPKTAASALWPNLPA
jgi:hypothetical protein